MNKAIKNSVKSMVRTEKIYNRFKKMEQEDEIQLQKVLTKEIARHNIMEEEQKEGKRKLKPAGTVDEIMFEMGEKLQEKEDEELDEHANEEAK